ncbi:hypothetical protein CHS0354_021514 [Potamilus streckersoni]|uniref:Uncharacterized protein n=1 Tax=Potamilus streckersoni TaxID=2493646 RepID=A0AAE0VZ54_9BIVA|nr:hypothetical protein CHS0354_021514 [Potamilus streckersoni]
MHKVCGEKRSTDCDGADEFVYKFCHLEVDEHLSPEKGLQNSNSLRIELPSLGAQIQQTRTDVNHW